LASIGFRRLFISIGLPRPGLERWLFAGVFLPAGVVCGAVIGNAKR
jgi:hypothetical protein